MTDDYDPADNSRRCYDLAIAVLREKDVRAHKVDPREDNEDEMRWWREGPKAVDRELDTVRNA